MLAALVVGLGGCAAQGPAFVDVPAAAYSRAFEATRRVLVESSFELDRVDARAGVITTRARPGAGLLTPWDSTPTTVSQRVEDTLNAQRRSVRVYFEPAGATADDLRESQPSVRARFEVAVHRFHRPGWELDATAVRSSGVSSSRRDRERGLQGGFETTLTLDPELAARLARRTESELARVPASR